MPKLTLVYYGKDGIGRPSHVDLANIKCEDMLEGLATLHERLNEVGMPRLYRSTADLQSGDNLGDVIKDIQGEDHFVCVSC